MRFPDVLLTLLMITAGSAASAQDPAALDLPGAPVSTFYGSGTDAFLSVELQGVGSGYDVADGLYDGWSLEDSALESADTATLLSSYDPALPAEITVCGGGPCSGTTLPWDKLNYVLNNKRGDAEDIQAAIWLLMWGRSNSISPTPLSLELFDDADSNGAGFLPGVGQVVAVVLYTQDGFGLGWHGLQESVIEVSFDRLACKVTAGANSAGGMTSDGDWDGTFARKKIRGRSTGQNQYKFGGNAESLAGDQPSDRWCHENTSGPDGKFTFDAGESQAGTWVSNVGCADPGLCFPSLQAPGKQIDLQGVGVFSKLSDPSPALADVIPGVTVHWFTVHAEDLGEPGTGAGVLDTTLCAGDSSGGTANCECPDFYSITIYRGYDPDTEPPNATDVIYEEGGFISSGNLQMHPAQE